MVGVPGKSKGCNTCRRRKKGCDQQRPICGQCAASGYVCGGYQRDRTFILHPASKAVEKAKFIPHPNLVKDNLSAALSRTAVDTQCRSLFWDLYMPTGDCVVRDQLILKCGHPMNWAELVPSLVGNDASLENAFSAVSISRVGKENNDPRLVRESTKLYGKALKDMQLALYDKKRMLSIEVLTATMLLGLYEVLEGPGPKAHTWLSHAQGAARLIELRGPQQHQKWHAHHIFLGSRMFTVYAAILQRKATYLATEEWLTVPWDEHRHRTYFDRMMDMVTVVPGLLEQVDATIEAGPSKATFSRQLDLLYQFECLQRSMDMWKNGMKKGAEVHTIPHEVVEGDNYPFETEFSFENHIFMKAHTIFWTCCLVIAETADDLMIRVNAGEHKDLYLDTNHLFDARSHAVSLCQAIPYCLKPVMGALGASLISFPANMAFRHFRRCGDIPITSWLVKVFKETRDRGLQWNSQLLEHFMPDSTMAENSAIDARNTGHTPDESSSKADSPNSSSNNSSSSNSIFIYEDPSQYYIDSSFEKD